LYSTALLLIVVLFLKDKRIEKVTGIYTISGHILADGGACLLLKYGAYVNELTNCMSMIFIALFHHSHIHLGNNCIIATPSSPSFNSNTLQTTSLMIHNVLYYMRLDFEGWPNEKQV
jgi:hypothetical protein